MRLDVKIDTAALILRLKNGEKRLAYAVVNAINNTAKRVQEGERQNILARFEVRKSDFIMREAAKIKPFANVKQGRPYAEIAVGQKPRLLLGEFERGGIKRPAKGGSVGVPITGSAARRSFPTPVPEELYFRNLNLRRRKSAKAQVLRALQGDHETYTVPDVGVFRRTGPGEGQTEMIYAFVKSPKLKPQLHFVETAKRVADAWFKEEMQKETINALARARGAGL